MNTSKQGKSNGKVVVIYNPVKSKKVADFSADCEQAAHLAGFKEIKFIETKEDSPGPAEAKQALELGADRVIAAGGDGTIRLVAGTLAAAEAEVTFGILPLGTGNLYARNVGIPIDDWTESLRIAFGGQGRKMDLVWMTPAGEPQPDPNDPAAEVDTEALTKPLADGRHPFLVIAGIGFDARMIADTSDSLKKKIGWVAYVAAGAKNLFRRPIIVKVSLNDGETVRLLRPRSLLFANSGKLPGGMSLVPDALPDDGVIDVCSLDFFQSMIGWPAVALQVLLQTFGIRQKWLESWGKTPMTFEQARKARCRLDTPHQVQVDGDSIGRFQELKVEVQSDAIRVACPPAAAAQ